MKFLSFIVILTSFLMLKCSSLKIYNMKSKQPPSWISKCFQNVRKPPKKNLKVLKITKMVQQNLKKGEKIIAFKVYCYWQEHKNYKFGETYLSKCRCHDNVKFSTQIPILPNYSQIIPRLIVWLIRDRVKLESKEANSIARHDFCLFQGDWFGVTTWM